MLIRINLLPEEIRKKEASFYKIDISSLGLNLQKLPILKIGGIAVGAIIVLTIVLFVLAAHARASLDKITKYYDTLWPKRQESVSLKSQVDTIVKKLVSIDALMVNRFRWANKLEALGDSMTPGIWLKELSYEEKPVETSVDKYEAGQSGMMRYLIMSGYASSKGEQGAELIGKFMKSLKDNKDFYSDLRDIELGTIKSERMEGQEEVMSFAITCRFK